MERERETSGIGLLKLKSKRSFFLSVEWRNGRMARRRSVVMAKWRDGKMSWKHHGMA